MDSLKQNQKMIIELLKDIKSGSKKVSTADQAVQTDISQLKCSTDNNLLPPILPCLTDNATLYLRHRNQLIRKQQSVQFMPERVPKHIDNYFNFETIPNDDERS